MDVKRWALFVVFALLLASCNKSKTLDTVFPDNKPSGSADPTHCSPEAIKKLSTSFIVQWEDGHVTVEKSENANLLTEKLIKPHLQEIKHVEFNSLITLEDQYVHSDSALPVDWGQQMVKAPAAWAQNVKGQGVTVAIVDTAVDYTHPDLKTQMIPGWDFVSNQQTAPAPHEHATHVAGIIGGMEGGGVKGLAPQVKMMGVSFLGPDGSGTLGDAIKALQYAGAQGIKIINNSWGGSGCSEALRDVMSGLESQGVLLLVAAGNDGVDIGVTPSYPASFNLANQITVAANDFTDTMSSFSNESWSLVHLSAPGENIYSSVPNNIKTGYYDIMSGTSMATPFLTGAAALLASVRPNATPAQLKQALLNSADVRHYKVLTQGRLNIENAILEIKKLVP